MEKDNSSTATLTKWRVIIPQQKSDMSLIIETRQQNWGKPKKIQNLLNKGPKFLLKKQEGGPKFVQTKKTKIPTLEMRGPKIQFI